MGPGPSAEVQVSLLHLPMRFLHVLLGTISLRMFFWFFIVTRASALKENNTASVEHSGGRHSAETFYMDFVVSSSQPSYNVAVFTSI